MSDGAAEVMLPSTDVVAERDAQEVDLRYILPVGAYQRVLEILFAPAPERDVA